MTPILFFLLRCKRSVKTWILAVIDLGLIFALVPLVLALQSGGTALMTPIYAAAILMTYACIGLHRKRLRGFDTETLFAIILLTLGIIATGMLVLNARGGAPLGLVLTYGLSVMFMLSLYRIVAVEGIRWVQKVWEVQAEDLLGRDRSERADGALSEVYFQSTVLVTGAGGSIGSEICKEILAFKPKRLILFDLSEFNLYKIEGLLRAQNNGATEIVPVLGDVTNTASLAKVFLANKIDIVLHAAAYKHVPLVEKNCLMGVRNNVLGTRALAKMAAAQKVKRFVNVSTDKAVRPTSMMGASKRVAELVVQDLAGQNTDTKFSIVRFGNVLGSSGSVVPAFRNQIKSGGPVTVTHQNITRYFMTTSEAAELVLTAGAISAGGEVYLLDMGNPVRIFDLAKSMIERSGNRLRSSKQPDGDIEINISGLRPGEKIFEELLIDATAQPTSHPKIFKAQEPYLSEIETARMMQDIEFALKAQDENQLRHVVFGWIAEKETSFENQEFRKAS